MSSSSFNHESVVISTEAFAEANVERRDPCICFSLEEAVDAH